MPKEPPPDGKRSKKGLNHEALVVLIFSVFAFTGNIVAWVFRARLETVDVVYFDFGLLFFLAAFIAAGRLRGDLYNR